MYIVTDTESKLLEFKDFFILIINKIFFSALSQRSMERKKVAKQKPLMVAVAMTQELIINNTLRSTRSQRRKDGNEKPPRAMVETAMAQQVIAIIHKVF